MRLLCSALLSAKRGRTFGGGDRAAANALATGDDGDGAAVGQRLGHGPGAGGDRGAGRGGDPRQVVPGARGAG